MIRVAGPAPYDVVVGDHLADRLPDLIGAGVQRVAVIRPASQADRARPLVAALRSAYDVIELPLPDGEAAKTAAVAATCWEALGAAGFTRSDVVVTFGGGATTDVGGFVAATWLRGVRVVHVPTTLLAMVDAAVGGKTGINTGSGKNLVGSFHEPAGVLCDLAALETLPRAELVAGLGEVVKCGFIADPEILDLVEARDAAELSAGLAGAARAGRARDRGQGRRRGGRPQGDRRRRRAPRPRGPQLRPHHGARHRAHRGLPDPARRGGRDRLRLRRRAGRAGRPPRSGGRGAAPRRLRARRAAHVVLLGALRRCCTPP